MQKWTEKALNLYYILLSNKGKVVSGILIALLILGLGISVFNSQGGNEVWALRIGRDYVPKSEFEDEIRKFKASNESFGVSDEDIKRHVAGKIAMQRALDKELRSNGITIDNSMVQKIVVEDERFIESDKFAPHKFKSFLENSNITEEQYYQAIKDNLTKAILLSFPTTYAWKDPNVAKLVYNSRHQKRCVDIYRLNPDKIPYKSNISDEEISEFYNQNRNLFKNPNKYDIEYIRASDISKHLNYSPNQEQVASILKSYPKMTVADIKKAISENYKCAKIQDILKSVLHQDESVFRSLADSYGIKAISTQITLDNKNTKYSSLKDMKSGGVIHVRTGTKCDDVEIVLLKKIHPDEFQSFDSAKQSIRGMIIKQKQIQNADEIATSISSDAKFNNLNEIKIMSSILQDKHFIVEKNVCIERINAATKNISENLMANIFFAAENGLTKVTQEENPGHYSLAFINQIIENKSENPAEINVISDTLYKSKVADFYTLYYMYLQDKYEIEINNTYFGTYVIK